MSEILEDFDLERERVTNDALKEIAKETCKILRQTSPKSKESKRSGRYARGWRYKWEYNEVVVYNQTDWQLTHLLADGHRIFNRYGGPFGSTSGNRHIDNAAEWGGKELPVRISRGLK